MIRRYNFHQVLRALFHLVSGLLCYFLAYLFFRYAPEFICHQFDIPLSTKAANGAAALGLAVVTFSGYRSWRAGGGLRGYHESALYHDLGEETAGAFVVDFYAHRVTGPAHVLSQVFLAGPLGLLNFRTTLSSLIPHSDLLAGRLEKALEVLQTTNKWQSITDHPDITTEILYLAQMDQIDFSTATTIPRIKAHTPKNPAPTSS